jgi:nicotinate-nucleotide adenylyltransferase
MRVCLLGGTFDPPHWGHVILAETLRSHFELEKFLFIPAYIPPHKQDRTISDARHRIEMLEIITGDNPYFSLDTCEIDREGVSYTIDTVREMKTRESLNSDEIGFLIGSDNYQELHKWKNADQLVDECQVVVAKRPDYPLGSDKKYEDKVTFVNLPRVEISSSRIRERVQKGESIKYYVLPVIEEYIYAHNLYSGESVKVVEK